jgi:glyoxylase I family protein
MFKRIDHVELTVDNPDETIAFYTGVLGFRVRSRDRIDRSALGVPLNLAYLELGGTTIEVIHYEGLKPAPAPQGDHLGYGIIALEVDDMQKALDYLKTKGVECTWGPRTRERYARAEIRDPNGHSIELRQWFT